MQSDQIRKSIESAIQKIGLWRRKPEGTTALLPPFLATQAIYNDRLKMAKCFSAVVLLFSAGIVTLQEIRFRGALQNALNREFLIVPGVVDFMKVRPGIIPENVVFYFAEYISEQIGTFSFHNIEDKYSRAGQFMTPQFREYFLSEMRRNLPIYREVSVTEIFNPRPTREFKQLKDESGNPYYEVNVEGTLEKFTNDQRIETKNEVISMAFRTTRIVPDKPWFFELFSLKRQSVEEFNREKSAVESLAQRERRAK